MMSKLAEKAVDKLFDYGKIMPEDKELYIYGFFMLFSKSFYLFLTIIYGILFELFFESIIFFISFMVIRGFAGGMHAKKESSCIFSTSFAFLTCILLIKCWSILEEVVLPIAVLIVCSVVISFLSPMDSPEKPLNKMEYREYRTKSTISLVAILVVSTICLVFGWCGGLYACAISVLLESLLLIVSSLQKVRDKFTR